ncbi:hypothetical protein Golax_025763, partial [Gossypium laxum]|nr:hypothetical protein [Gossypium laxum]
DFTRIRVTQNNLQELKEIWDRWDDEIRQLFYSNYGDLPYLLDIKVDKYLFRALAQLDKRVTPVLAILAKTFRSLNACRRAGEGRFIGAHWMIPNEILYQCGDFDWVPLLKFWGAVGYALLLVLRQYRSRQFIPVTQGLALCGFSYKGDNYKKKGKRINDNIPESSQEDVWPLEEHLQVIPSESEIIKQDFEKRSSELGKKIEQLEEEKMCLGLDVDIHKLEAKKLRRGKNKAEEDLDSLKTDYKKLRLLMRIAGLGKTSEQWRQEIKEEKIKANQWEKKFQGTRAREVTLERSRLECQNEKAGLRAEVVELEKSLYQYRGRNSAIELKARLSKIEELRGMIGELEDALQNIELRVELLERGNEQWQEQLHCSQGQIRERDYIMGEAVAQVQEVADHLQTLVVQADVLSLKYESESDRGRELAWLLRKVKALSIRAKSYM